MGHRVAIQTAKTKISASFLLWGDMGSLDCKSANNISVKKHQEALCILAGCYHGTTYAHVLRRFIAFMENPEKTWNDFLAERGGKKHHQNQVFSIKGAYF